MRRVRDLTSSGGGGKNPDVADCGLKPCDCSTKISPSSASHAMQSSAAAGPQPGGMLASPHSCRCNLLWAAPAFCDVSTAAAAPRRLFSGCVSLSVSRGGCRRRAAREKRWVYFHTRGPNLLIVLTHIVALHRPTSRDVSWGLLSCQSGSVRHECHARRKLDALILRVGDLAGDLVAQALDALVRNPAVDTIRCVGLHRLLDLELDLGRRRQWEELPWHDGRKRANERGVNNAQ